MKQRIIEINQGTGSSCGGLEHAVKMALQNSERFRPRQTVTISADGTILE